MPTGCCVPECTNQIGGFTFPLDKKKAKLWLDSIKRYVRDTATSRIKAWKHTKYSVVCKEHFLPSDFCHKAGESLSVSKINWVSAYLLTSLLVVLSNDYINNTSILAQPTLL